MNFISRKLISLTFVFILLINNSNFAHAAENEPVADAEVILSTFDADGNLVPISGIDPVDTGPGGEFNIDLPLGFPEHKPVFAVVQDKSGEGVQNISCVSPKEPAQVDPASTAIGNAFLSFANETEDFNPHDTDASQLENFVEKMKEAVKDVPPADTAADSVLRFADALGLHPDAFLDAVGDFNVDPADKLRVAALINDAAAPTGFNVLDGKPPKLPEDIPPGSHIPGLIPPEFLKDFAPPDFDFHEHFGEGVLPPGGLIGEIPPDAFLMPPGLEANPHIPFGEEPFFPQGVKIPGDFPMPPEAHLPPGIIFDDGFEPPPGLPIPPGFIGPPGFDPLAFGAVPLDAFEPPPDFRPPPGFGLVDDQGGFGMPPGFPIPEGVQLPPEALEFPPPPGFIPFDLPPGFEQEFIPPIPPGFAFGDGAHFPPAFDPNDFGFQPPPDFIEHKFGGEHADFEQFKGDDFIGFDPFGGFNPEAEFGGFFGPPLDENGIPIPGAFDPFAPPPPGADFPGGFDPGFDPFAPFKPGEPPPDGGFDPNFPGDPAFPPPPDGGFDPNFPGDPAFPPPDGGFDPNFPGDPALPPPDGGAVPPPPGDPGNQPPPDGGAVPPPPGDPGNQPPPPDGGAVPPPPPPPPAGEPPPPPPPPPQRVQARLSERVTIDTRNTKQIIAKSGENSLVVVSSPEGTNARTKKGRKITASEGVYLTGKVKASKTDVKVPVIIDPSITASSVKVTLSVNNKVETTDVEVIPGAIQLITQLEGNQIQMSTANTNIDLDVNKVKGFLLAPGTSALEFQKAIKIKGKVTEGDGNDIISFKSKKGLSDGIYTITFRDGLDLYYGKVTIGEIETQTITGTVLAPGGQL